jgi:16S rRNA (guanine966-N2)-methyltransferase
MAEWNVQSAKIERADAFAYLRGPVTPFDIVYLDPPFASGLVTSAANLLEERGWLAPNALIYMECAARETPPALPTAWKELKAKQAGEVGYHLVARSAGESVPA